MRRRMPAPVLLLSLLLLAPRAASAQGDVLELTPAVLDRFIASATAEARERERLYASDPEVKKEMALQKCMMNATSEEEAKRCQQPAAAAGKTAAQQAQQAQQSYMACANKAVPGSIKLFEDYGAAVGKGDRATIQRLMPEVMAAQKAMIAACGQPPEEEREPDPSMQQQSPEEMARQEQVMEKVREFDEQARASASGAGKFTDRQYAIVRERILAYFRKQQENVPDSESSYSAYKYKPAELQAIRAYEAKLRPLLKEEL